MSQNLQDHGTPNFCDAYVLLYSTTPENNNACPLVGGILIDRIRFFLTLPPPPGLEDEEDVVGDSTVGDILDSQVTNCLRKHKKKQNV